MHSTHRRIICSDANYRAAHPSPLNFHHALADDVFSPPHRLALFTLERCWSVEAQRLAILRSRVITTGCKHAMVQGWYGLIE